MKGNLCTLYYITGQVLHLADESFERNWRNLVSNDSHNVCAVMQL